MVFSSSSEPVGPTLAAVKLTLEYDGGGFAGWAAQPGLRTVEGDSGWRRSSR